ncbi:hypothetical protein HF325_000918 [Metschnikowia pulcherrima]|uniref:Uncharacterized protein n=1 Tax=Metschnikowia pulcherrima TaxID=27326 RepID=A0A8H7GZJ0_9ASCO|nr:hypothetical protein HF325_000918 [Metschnikowia pulcherrima]
MLANADFVTASLSFVARADMPTLNTGTSTTSTSSSSSSSKLLEALRPHLQEAPPGLAVAPAG